ncbi:hypothetical protein PBI_KATHERINEG_97 [Gordonia phage KatherineG]|uniref:Uncharacterized protein n=2 Tax=Soupsvirus soups TaxID=1982563 RepID=A0A160DGK3_9CAUD|nr:hypothetical protein BEN61_gp014 [Gordonia phage Rosalind]YP_009269117.1 hypothetical protein BEN62_gp013 [Gordonia phage KatherineG]YP_009269396.1 hypothetical protein BEN59_gp013 [Gordonia phage Soups]ANA87033.1 hypothetical protein PBI_SOUPS_98 [Gordonia phage Soups]ANA87130.1 hypothetical protein PBI_ROSALIND_97 [Gordonia phage Rosalind]ANA87230.1 hypothetical protein PBI_KATHERINEG_97 [Gordonia phage KatherineG]
MLKDEKLQAYAEELKAAGFEVWIPTRPGSAFFLYSRHVDGQTCYGSVQQMTLRLEGYSHSMPIKPSREHGSSMFIEDVEDGWDCLTVEAAELIARPENYNPLVGRQKNHRRETDFRGYNKL